MKKKISGALAVTLLLSSLATSGCSNGQISFFDENVLRVASWVEYIDMGGEDSYYSPDSRPLYEEFEDWYYEQTGKTIHVEYVPLQDNETMYNKIKMGDCYDLLCPSEYMAMKLKSENRLEAYPQSFFDETEENNYYAKNVPQYIKNVFADADLTGYIAGYMWGTTGFVFNPEKVDEDIFKSWNCLSSEACKRKITAKDNVRDSYFMGLGMYYENELLNARQDYENTITLLQGAYENGSYTAEEYEAEKEKALHSYKSYLSELMNDITPETMSGVKELLRTARDNLYGLETDEGKMNIVTGRTNAAYQWSGDAVYILNEAEAEANLELQYCIPESTSNLWFDGWVMMKGANVDAATAFVNFVSMPQNAVRNMYYIGYTSCIGGEEVYQYVSDTYSAEDGDTDTALYDLSYFFGEEYEPLTVPTSQLKRQLFAQYPTEETTHRLVVMDYFTKKENERASRMWNNIK